MKDKFLSIIKKKWLKSAILTVVLFAIIIGAYAGIIYGMSKTNISDIDFTKDKIYSISQATKDRLKNLEEDITISVYNMSEYINDFAYKYANINDHIKIEEVDNLISKAPWKANYGVTDTSSFILIQAENKEKILYDSDLYTIDYTTYEQIDTTEEAITNAILDVITNVKPKICFLEGHNVYTKDYFQYIDSSLQSEANEIEYVNLLVNGKMPEDCKLLVITALKEDITEKERDLILEYINNGGEILLLADPNALDVKTPNFDKVLEQYGVSVSDGIVLEGDTSKMMAGAPNFIISTINRDSEIVKNINMDLNLCLINSSKLEIESYEELEKKNVTVEVLASLSDKAFYRSDLESNSLNKISSDKDATEEPIAAICTKQNGENTSKMIIFANTTFATNLTVQYSADYYKYALDMCNNKDVLLNSVSYLTEREDNITIRKNDETISTYDISEMQLRIVLGIIFAIPVFIIFIGIVIWILRRRK